MKLYIAYDANSSLCGCEFTKEAAVKLARKEGIGAYVDRINIDNPREALRRVLGGHGGYANGQDTVYTCKRGAKP